MPVPVPFVQRAPACLSRKHSNSGNSLRTPSSLTHHHGRALSLSSVGQPPVHNPLHLRTRHKDRENDCHRLATAVEGRDQGFRFGLASAANAPAIKGAHAKACFPPTFAFNGMDVELSNARPRTAGDLLNQDAVQDLFIDSCDDSQITSLRGWSSTPNLCLEDDPAVFAPLLEDDSSDLVNGDLGSSPMEPLTPFGEYVDRAVATSDAATIYDPLVSTGSQELPISYPSLSLCGSKYNHLQPCSVKEGVRSGTSQPPTATLTYKRFAEPMAEWVVTYVWKVCTNAIPVPHSIGRYTPNAAQLRLPAPLHLTNAVHSLLMSTLLQPSAVLLALWYIARLPVFFGAAGLGPEHVKERRFRVELLGDSRGNVDGESAEGTATFRLVVLGFMLANKWLDDHTFSNKTWHTISNVPIQILNRLEYFALDILSHDLSISSSLWSEWLKHLVSYHHSLSTSLFPQPISRPSSCPRSVIRSTIQEIMEAPLGHPSDEPVFLGVDQRLRGKFGFANNCGDADSFDINLDEDGPLREEYLPRRRAGDNNASRHIGPDRGSLLLSHYQSTTQSCMASLPPKWSPTGVEPVPHSNNRVGAIYVPAHPPLPARYVTPALATYPWTAALATYSASDGDYLGNYTGLSHNPCWCPPPQIRSLQEVQPCYSLDVLRTCSNGGGFRGTFDRACGEGRIPYGTGPHPFTTTTWVHPEPYNYVPSRQPLGPHPSVNHPSNWLRA